MITFEAPVMLVNLARTYHPEMSDADLYEAARGDWVIASDRASQAMYVVAVHRGRVVAVYRPEHWESVPAKPGRMRFSGQRDELKEALWEDGDVSAYFKPGAANPVRYVYPD